MKQPLKITDVEKLLKQMATVDNREVTANTISTWYDILLEIDTNETVSLADLLEALKECRKDTTVKWVEPRHIIARVKNIIAKRLEAEASIERKAAIGAEGVPCPECEHDKLIINCMPCAKKLN